MKLTFKQFLTEEALSWSSYGAWINSDFSLPILYADGFDGHFNSGKHYLQQQGVRMMDVYRNMFLLGWVRVVFEKQPPGIKIIRSPTNVLNIEGFKEHIADVFPRLITMLKQQVNPPVTFQFDIVEVDRNTIHKTFRVNDYSELGRIIRFVNQ